jgi:ribosomal protein S18 acetylase RimI-like enzyme
MSLTLRTPGPKEFQLICSHIGEYELDSRCLQADEFTAAFRQDELVGFGRLRKHPGFTELCSLGVITPVRRQGIGSALVNEFIRQSPQELYLVCIIPRFFIPFGFRTTAEYPAGILEKIDYCTSALVVPEPYVAMKFFP